jgi:hypothetical protein
MRTLIIIILTLLIKTCYGQYGVISGQIYDRKEKAGLAYASVGIKFKKGTSTDINGYFKIDSVPPGRHLLTVIYVGYSDTSFFVSVSANQTTNIYLKLPKPCRYDKSEHNKTCPKCNKKDQVVPIVYGELVFTDTTGTNDWFEKNYSGGCMVTECDPNWYCKRDKTKF